MIDVKCNKILLYSLCLVMLQEIVATILWNGAKCLLGKRLLNSYSIYVENNTKYREKYDDPNYLLVVQDIFTKVHVWEQGNHNDILLQVLSRTGLGYIYALVVSYPCSSKAED